MPGLSLFGLPLELRACVYDLLVPVDHVENPVPGTRLARCSRRLPQQYMLLIHPQFTAELLDYFARHTTWVITLPKVVHSPWDGRERERLADSHILPLIRDIQVSILQDVAHSSDNGKFGKFQSAISMRVAKCCEMLKDAPLLRIRLGWIESKAVGDWDKRAALFLPFKTLSPDAQILLDDFDGPTNAEDREAFEGTFSALMASPRRTNSWACTLSMPQR